MFNLIVLVIVIFLSIGTIVIDNGCSLKELLFIWVFIASIILFIVYSLYL